MPPEKRVFLDEAGFSLAMYQAYGWAPKEQRLVEAVPFQRGVNFSVLGAIGIQGMICTHQKSGSMKRVDMESFLEFDLLPRLRKGMVLILDNARIHHGGRIEEIVEAAGCSLLYLPAYSPDSGTLWVPIELAWSWIKRFVRRRRPRDGDSRLEAIHSGVAALPGEFAEKWFKKCQLQSQA